jgi:predicted glycoside hydrolase/deacetylase ChbG (UPF0249 family)
MKKTILFIAVFFSSLFTFSQSNKGSEKIPVLIRCDDIGMCHSVNMAARQVLETGLPVSMSVMVPCPWFSEAAEMLKQYKNVSVGIHLTLNAEWKNYRWGPVLGSKAVPSLVDSVGDFFPSRSRLFANNPKLSEIEAELRAQIEKAINSGLKIEYLDHHMGAAVQTPETRAIVEKLAKEFNLGISRYFDEVGVEGWYFAAPSAKADTMLLKLKNLQPGERTNLFVIHVGLESPEMNAMEDLNPFGPKEMSRHRFGELSGLISPKFQILLKEPRFSVLNYTMLIKEKSLNSMKRPSD